MKKGEIYVEDSLANSLHETPNGGLQQGLHQHLRDQLPQQLIAEPCIDLPAFIASKLAGRSTFSKRLARDAVFLCPSTRHGRSLAAPLSDGRWLSIKGCGWNWGPPWVWLSPKDPELCFGLLDRATALREVAVSKWLSENGVQCCRSTLLIDLDGDELALLGLDHNIRFLNGRVILPSALFTVSRASFRIADLLTESHSAALSQMQALFACTDSARLLHAFVANLVSSVNAYQSLGAVNDSLNAENVTVFGEVTDFEWFYVPGIPTPDGNRDENLVARQQKEGIYLIEVLILFARSIGIRLTVQDAADIAVESFPPLASRPSEFFKQLQEFSRN